MTKEEMISEAGKPLLNPLSFIQAISLLAFLISPFVWIWFGWGIAWKIALSGALGALIAHRLYWFAKKIVTKEVERTLRNSDENVDIKPTVLKKSKFHERLEEMANSKKQFKNPK